MSHWRVNHVIRHVNSLWPSDAIWHWTYWSTLVRVMACCLTAPSHYPNQRWLISELRWKSHEGNSRWYLSHPWWRHQMETFSALLTICAGISPVPGEFPTQRPVTRSFHVFFDLRLNKRLSKQSGCWWFETLSCSVWRHRNESPDLIWKLLT